MKKPLPFVQALADTKRWVEAAERLAEQSWHNAARANPAQREALEAVKKEWVEAMKVAYMSGVSASMDVIQTGLKRAGR